ncbi:type IV toxin-antitoxin system AbiEi family antitoxin domain-containing protein [Cryobacterium serini]|uniref:Transcriptional regulator, AbiEi antitoxin, Type IV TA system n=1 Tax=Cryobacterium serini TaxID=1259201 RepID=A0A4R9BMI5_9MICO|nr:hypothetical protein [Cryobacterium serini]TFD86183.1 hypothetical protein E3T51_13725 [Cryobacterium serini]
MSQPDPEPSASFGIVPRGGAGLISQTSTDPDPCDGLILASDLASALGVDFRLRRESTRGRLQRVSRGLYYPSARWNQLREDQRYLIRVRGAALIRRGQAVLCHHSAAVLWGLPMLVGWPGEVHLLTERASGGRSDPGIRRHALGMDSRDVTTIDGLLVTTIERTVVDLAATLDLKSAVAVVDRALYQDRFRRTLTLTTKVALLATLERMLPFRGSRRARAIIQFGTHLSGSPAESASRVNIALSGFPEPELQHPFIVDGKECETDFYWPEIDGVGECDGREKYFNAKYLAGRSPEQVQYDEKLREDGIRRQVHGFTRWPASVGMSQYSLRRRLLELGLQPGPQRALRGLERPQP